MKKKDNIGRYIRIEMSRNNEIGKAQGGSEFLQVQTHQVQQAFRGMEGLCSFRPSYSMKMRHIEKNSKG